MEPSGWSGVVQTVLDFLTLKDSGVGPPGLAFIIGLLLILYLYRNWHLDVRKHFQEEISRIASERDKWENRYFDDKLKSSQDEHYSPDSSGKKGDEPDGNAEDRKEGEDKGKIEKSDIEDGDKNER